jgi:hypothetical protein
MPSRGTQGLRLRVRSKALKPLSELIQRTAAPTADRILMYAVPGWGKTTMWSQARNPLFAMCKGDTGLLTLLGNNQIAETDYLPTAETWTTLCEYVEALIADPGDRKTFVMDTGFERLLHEHVCEESFKGDWGEKGFTSFQKGYTMALSPLRLFLSRLDALRQKHNVTIVLIAHSIIRPVPNPIGEDFKAYAADLHDKTFGLLQGWADMVLFGNYERFSDGKSRKEKESQKIETRVLYTKQTAAFQAKNRHGLASEIYMPDDPSQMMPTFREAMMKARKSTAVVKEPIHAAA